MRFSSAVLVVLINILCSSFLSAQGPGYGMGRTPTPQEIRAWDIAVGPSGRELPPGSGTARQGAPLYAARCSSCHGQTAAEGPTRPLVGGQGTLTTIRPQRSIESFWPFSTTIWDFINRAMPRNEQGTLSPDQVYALTAFLLYRSNIIEVDEVMDAASLPKVRMPNRGGFVPDPWPEWKPGEIRPHGLYP